MTSRELERRVDALRRPLEVAAADGFAGVRRVQGLGNALRLACDAVLAGGGAEIEGLAAWRQTLTGWEQLGEYEQAVEVARGMRLIARVARPPGATIEREIERARRAASDPAAASGSRPTSEPRASERGPSGSGPSPSARASSRGPSGPGPSGAGPSPSELALGASGRRPSGAGPSSSERARGPSGRGPSGAGPTSEPRTSGRATSAGAVGQGDPTRSEDAGRSTSTTATSGAGTSGRATARRPARGQPAEDHAGRDVPPSRPPAVPVRQTAMPSATTPLRPVPDDKARLASGGSPRDAAKAATASTASTGRGDAKPQAAGRATSRDDDAAGRGPRGAATASAEDGADDAPAKPTRGRRGGTGAGANGAADADVLAAPTYALPGIGPALAEKMAARGLETVEDLLWMVPRRYDDVRTAGTLGEACELDEGVRATFTARVASSRMVFGGGRRRWGEVRLVGIEPDRSAVTVRWFNVYGGIEKKLPAGSMATLSGPVRRRNGRVEFANPDILAVELPDATMRGQGARIIARYPDIAGVPAGRLRQACATACARVGDAVEDGVPAHVEQAAGMPSLAAALAQLHAPVPDTPADELAAMNRGDSRWQRRLAFGELFALGIAVARRRRERRTDAAIPCERGATFDGTFTRAIPFAPTKAQRRAIDELGADLARAVPMNRLLQGDVGSGKTCVAFAAALQVAQAGRQVAVMAPTELLAEQHHQTWRAWAEAAKLRVDLLTASTPKGVRASLLALLAAGQLDVLIGTHSLLGEGVGFAALGLVVIDEQHRFGVAQRVKLRDKGDGQGAPHLLVMTATPIPRTLALTAYGDLDVSTLDELPPGRTPIATKLLTGARGRQMAEKLIADRVAAGERAYVVCPKIEPSDPDEDDEEDARVWKDAVTTATELAAELPTCRVGLVHGRLDAAERDRVMRAFKDGTVDVLVATTVIEVGVDVPAATLMVIHDAERFGLAQLHQLRGRVGRGRAASACLLLVQGALGEDAGARLEAMVATTDGFRIAEEDLRLRGPGELLGPRQAGIPRLRFGDLAQHTELLLEARRQAEAVLDGDPDLVRPEHATLRRTVARRLARDVYGADGG